MSSENNLLPPPTTNQTNIKLKYKPRPLFPVHYYCKTNNEINSIDLISLPMYNIRGWTGIKSLKTSESQHNLQVWVNNLGPALYNPIEWKWKLEDHKRPVTWRGAHRLRALEALDFNYIYVYQIIGNKIPPLPKHEIEKMKKNRMVPTQKTSSRSIPCEKCGWLNSWKIKKPKLLNLRYYKCKVCNYYFETEVVYPEPM